MSVGNTNPGMPRNTDDSGGEGVSVLIQQNTNISVGRTGFLQKVEYEGSPDVSYQSSVTSQVGAIVTGEKDVKKPWNTDTSIGVIRFTHTKPSDVVNITVDDTDREDCAGSPIGESEQPLFTRNMDPVPKWTGFTPSKPSDVVFMNIDYDDRPDVEQKSPSSDSGIHSYDDNCTSLSTDYSNSDVHPSPDKIRSGDSSLALRRAIPVGPIDTPCSQAVVTELEAAIPDYASDATFDGYQSDVADLAGCNESWVHVQHPGQCHDFRPWS